MSRIKEAEFAPDKRHKDCIVTLTRSLERLKSGKGDWVAVVMSVDNVLFTDWSYLSTDEFAVAGSVQFLAHRIYEEKMAQIAEETADG